MSIVWSVLIIVVGGILAIGVYCAAAGQELQAGADRLVDEMRRERDL